MVALPKQHNILDFSEPVHKQGKSNEWYTPAKYIEAAREVMGGVIDLDPASCEIANQTVRARRYYTKEDNGLNREWMTDSLWLNPPYAKDECGQSNLEKWVWKLLQQYETGNTRQAILLVPMTQATKWFDRLWDYLQCFPPYRIHFYSSGVNDWRPRFSSSFAYLGPNEQKFIDTFSQFGRIAKAVDTSRKEITPCGLWDGGNT